MHYICWIPRVVLNPSLIGEGFNDPLGFCIRKSCLIGLLHRLILSFELFLKSLEKFNFCITNVPIIARKHEGFVSKKNVCSRAKTLRHSDITELSSLLCTLLSIFVTAQNAYTFSKQAVHQQHVNCLINTWVCAG